MTQELYQTALKFAGEKHHDQKVSGTTANYLLHVSNVTMEVILAYVKEQNFDLDFAMQVAILHDTIEDTDATYEEIKSMFGEQIAVAVLALTKDDTIETKSEKMADSIRRINLLQKEVGIVKLADRITNLQKPPQNWSKDKIKGYAEEARIISSSLSNKNPYLNARLMAKIKEYEVYGR